MPLDGVPGPRLTRSQLGGLDLVTHLLQTPADYPQPLVAHAVESFFAPHMGTVGCVGVRGPTAVREVLTNATDFAPLQPAIDDVPPDVQRLSAGMFTMDGELHARFRSELRGLFSLDEQAVRRMTAAVEAAVGSWIGARRSGVGPSTGPAVDGRTGTAGRSLALTHSRRRSRH